jgi:Rrf2 family protein
MLSQKTRYALRALLFLAERAGARPVQIAEIAETQQVPRKYLELIMLDLKRAGLVASGRGPGGGYVLARRPEDISFVEVIRTTDGPIAMVPCASLNFYARCADCRDETACAIRRVMSRVRDDAVRVLESVSLADAANMEHLLAEPEARPA